MGAKKPSGVVHIIEVGYTPLAVPDEATLAKLLAALSKCQVMDHGFDGGYYRPRYREGVSFKTVPAEQVHLHEERPDPKAARGESPLDGGTIDVPGFDATEPPPTVVRARSSSRRHRG